MRLDLIAMVRENRGVFQRKESPMIERCTFGTASGTVADNKDSFVIGPRAPILIDAFEPLERPARGGRSPRLAVISGSAAYNAPPMTIDVTDYRQIKASAQTATRTDRSRSWAAGALAAFATAAVVAITFSLTPASDGPAPVDGPVPDTAFCTFRGEFRPEFRSYRYQPPSSGESRCPFATRL
jgi:hypothetical protein